MFTQTIAEIKDIIRDTIAKHKEEDEYALLPLVAKRLGFSLEVGKSGILIGESQEDLLEELIIAVVDEQFPIIQPSPLIFKLSIAN